MAVIIHKWFLILAMLCSGPVQGELHPYYVSVTEIEHNAGAQTLEVSCKIFTDDFETTLRNATGKKIDLLNPARKNEMKPFVEAYIRKHLKIVVDGTEVHPVFLGYEQDEEGIISYFEVAAIRSVKKLLLINDLLYETHSNQIGLIHVTVGGKRKSFKLDNPEREAVFNF